MSYDDMAKLEIKRAMRDLLKVKKAKVDSLQVYLSIELEDLDRDIKELEEEK